MTHDAEILQHTMTRDTNILQPAMTHDAEILQHMMTRDTEIL